MKKSVLPFALALCFQVYLYAQPLPYDFVATSEPYQTLTGATELSPVLVWEEEAAALPLGFPFLFGNQTSTSLYVTGTLGGLTTNQIDLVDTVDLILGFTTATGLMPASGTSVRFQTDGAPPNRICKIEWFKAGFYDEAGEVSFQIWLHENDDVIQIRLGPRTVPEPTFVFANETSPLIGLLVNFNLDSDPSNIGYGHYVVGNANQPNSVVVYNEPGDEQPLYGCASVPAENLVLTFYPAGVLAAGEANAPQTRQFFPNPVVADELHCADPADDFAGLIQIFDGAGRLVLTRQLPSGTNTLPLPPDLSPGLYWLRQMNDGKITVGKFIKG